MSASTAARFDLKYDYNSKVTVPIAASTKIYSGTAVCTDASGNLNPGADTSGLKFHGIARQDVDNSADGTGGALSAEVDHYSNLQLVEFNATSPDQTWVGCHVALTDDHTVNLNGSTTNHVVVGVVAQVLVAAVAGKVQVYVGNLAALTTAN